MLEVKSGPIVHKCQGKRTEKFTTRDLIINKETDIPTFENIRGRSWIDLTLCNSIQAQKTRGWTCGEEESCADRKIIFFDIESMEVGGKAIHYLGKRNITKAERWGTLIN